MTTQPAAGRKRRLPRMRLATFMLLVAVCGPAARYIYDVRVQQQAVRDLRNAGATVVYDWEQDPGAITIERNGKELSGWRRIVADRFGPDAVSSVVAVALQEVGGQSDSAITDEHIALIGRLKSLRALWLGKLAVTEASAEPIAGLKQLRLLLVYNPREKSDPGPILSRLDEGSRLERLELLGTALDDEDIAAIARLPLLETLRIFGDPGAIDASNLRDADLEKLAGLARLKTFWAHGTRVTTEGLKSLARVKSLESITFQDSSMIDDLAPLIQFPMLKELELGHSPIGDEALSALAGMPALKKFSALSHALTDAGLAQLRNHPTLEELRLESVSITNAGLAQLRGTPALETLGVRDATITAAGLEPLAAIKTLKHIDLYNCRITPQKAAEFTKAHPGISINTAH